MKKNIISKRCDSEKLLCKICKQSVPKSSFSRHCKSHNRQLKCQCCSLSFNRKDNWLRHMKQYHSDTNLDEETDMDTTSNSSMSSNNSSELIVDEEKLKTSLINFKVKSSDVSPITSPDFVHPFSCKIIGPRGSGKTSFMVSYITQIACLTFKKIFIISRTPDQPLYGQIKGNTLIEFVELDELEFIVSNNKDILIVFDDVMYEARNSATIENIHTRGRHQRISVMSLEQDMFYSNHIERRNVDYFVITKLRDTSCLNEFYKRYCQDIQQWRFITLYEFAMKAFLGFIIIDFKSNAYKYRINSLNVYFSLLFQSLQYIYEADEDELKSLNFQLDKRFTQDYSRVCDVSKIAISPQSNTVHKQNKQLVLFNKPKQPCKCCDESSDEDEDSRTSKDDDDEY